MIPMFWAQDDDVARRKTEVIRSSFPFSRLSKTITECGHRFTKTDRRRIQEISSRLSLCLCFPSPLTSPRLSVCLSAFLLFAAAPEDFKKPETKPSPRPDGSTPVPTFSVREILQPQNNVVPQIAAVETSRPARTVCHQSTVTLAETSRPGNLSSCRKGFGPGNRHILMSSNGCG
jgi:hypothetical protein